MSLAFVPSVTKLLNTNQHLQQPHHVTPTRADLMMSQKRRTRSKSSSVWRVYTQTLITRATSPKQDVQYDKHFTKDVVNTQPIPSGLFTGPKTTTADKFIARSMGNTKENDEDLQRNFRNRQRSAGDVMTEWFQTRREAVLHADNEGYQESLYKNFPTAAKNYMKKTKEGNEKGSEGPVSLTEFRKRLKGDSGDGMKRNGTERR